MGAGFWRRALIALGFPVSVLLLGAGDLPAWAWLLPLGVLWSMLAFCARRTPRGKRAWPWLLAGIAAWCLPVAVGIGGLDSETQRGIATSKGAYLVADSMRLWRRAPNC